MDLNLIQTFLVVAEFQSYTKAAEQLGLTQPAVSAAIKRLEQVAVRTLVAPSRAFNFACNGSNPSDQCGSAALLA